MITVGPSRVSPKRGHISGPHMSKYKTVKEYIVKLDNCQKDIEGGKKRNSKNHGN